MKECQLEAYSLFKQERKNITFLVRIYENFRFFDSKKLILARIKLSDLEERLISLVKESTWGQLDFWEESFERNGKDLMPILGLPIQERRLEIQADYDSTLLESILTKGYTVYEEINDIPPFTVNSFFKLLLDDKSYYRLVLETNLGVLSVNKYIDQLSRTSAENKYAEQFIERLQVDMGKNNNLGKVQCLNLEELINKIRALFNTNQ